MTNSNCTGAPLSWLVMEQYHLGELPQTEQERVKQHLHSCPGCEKCMDSIANSTVRLKPLPELPTGFWVGLEAQWKLGAGLVAAAAACVLALIFVAPTTTDTGYPPSSMGYKGGDLAIGLTRHREDSNVENPTKYAEGDSFNVRVTCPPNAESQWDVTVFQGSEVFFPYDNARPIQCGNRVALSGSFGISGNKTTVVCVTVDETFARHDVMKNGISALPDSTVCTQLRPVK